MADKRMMTKKVTDDDNFLSLSASAQALYLHLSVAADDDGFNNQVNTSMFKAHASLDDLRALLEKRYIIQFDSGVIVIKHWRMANALRSDRYKPTAFQEEFAQLCLNDNGSYSKKEDGCQLVAKRLPVGCPSIDKNSIDKNSIDYSSKEAEEIVNDRVAYLEEKFGRTLNANELKFFLYNKQWDDEVLDIAIDLALDNNKLTLAYIKAILNNWLTAGYKTAEQIRQHEQSKNKTTSKKYRRVEPVPDYSNAKNNWSEDEKITREELMEKIANLDKKAKKA